MNTLPTDIIAILVLFAPLFTRPVFRHVGVLVCGAILCSGKRTITSALRVMGLSDCKQFNNYHRVLNRAKWNSRKAAHILLGMLVRAFTIPGPIVIGIDETLERRRGAKIAAKGIYRDSVRSSHSFFVKSSGLRWISMMLLVPIPWAARVWALPFLTVLAPSERYNSERRKRHKKLTDWARQMVIQARRWLPDRALVLVADSSYAALSFLDSCAKLTNPVTVITRLRLDAGLYEPPPARKPGAKGRPRKKGKRLPTLNQVLRSSNTVWQEVTISRWYSQGERKVEITSDTCIWYHGGQPVVPIRWVLIRDPEGKFSPQVLLCTDQSAEPAQIISWFILRWQIETTFQEVRTHLGVETQRQWNDLAIARTTPVLMGLFSLITLMAHPHFMQDERPVRQSSWYVKEHPTFSDAIAWVRWQLWQQRSFCMSSANTDSQESPETVIQRFTQALCYST